ncbi:receptor-like protein 2 [Pyrus ussuriensis x Pyrus communis]|uniref:Receptor-like protein 2 n=1 Tax=Pyrus ussuriensis x Pyrus communis TaxID=2448454 RepID=A0A5N5GQ18_9ROSA|nr:receptor-like protein 2 [Pyrus ussuriensis x Pyrus communis]
MAHGFLLMILLFTSIISPNIHACNQNDHSSLLSFNLTLYSPPLNWNSVNCCSWEGITCNPEGRVINLLLPSERLDGVIFTSSSSLANLTHLTHLNLSSNSLHGSLKNKLFESLNSLKILDLSYNLLSGELPLSLTSGNIRTLDLCSELQIFHAGHNNLSGLLPEDIYNAIKLEEVAIPLNSLYGGISDKIVNLTNLAILDLSFNQLCAVLPLRLGKLSRLKIVMLNFNDLQGPLPQSLMNCTNLVELRLGQNNLEGNIAKLNFSKRTSSLNNLEGQIQSEILSLNSLSFLSLSDMENVTGAMKMLMHCKSLRALILSYSFKGEGMPSDDDMVRFDGFQNLRIFTLLFCDLTGRLPHG